MNTFSTVGYICPGHFLRRAIVKSGTCIKLDGEIDLTGAGQITTCSITIVGMQHCRIF